MNRRFILNILGKIMLIEAGLMLLPMLVAAIYREKHVYFAFGIPIAMLAVLGALFVSVKVYSRTIFARDGYVMVAAAWIVLSFFGALPFTFSNQIPHLADSFFETVSGFTTTGASILTNVEALSKSMLFWRSFTHWIGGMGVLVFMLAIIPLTNGSGSLQLVRAESTGPDVGKLVPKTTQSARILYMIYGALTVIEFVLLIAGKMPVFDAVCVTFGTAGTGGFGVLNSSVASYGVFCQIVITVFMLLFGVNFSIFYLILCGRVKDALKSEELRVYLAVYFAAALIITINIRNMYESFSQSALAGFFQTSSIMTTTGFSTVDFDAWPELSRYVLLLIMCIGSCAGSTGGGIKISRLCILVKSAQKEIRCLLHPRSVNVVRFEKRRISDKIVNTTHVYLILYVLIIGVSVFIVSFDNFDFTTTFSGVLATFNNIGPGLGKVGPTANYSGFSNLSKLVFSLDMLLGRLEIFPIIMLFNPALLKNYRIRKTKISVTD